MTFQKLKNYSPFKRLLLFFCILSTTGCYSQSHSNQDADSIISINIVDRNGLSETISSQERLKQFSNTNFLASQPYQKVSRVYKRNKQGEIRSYLTSYHPNGEPKQYLEVINNRAYGRYQEWHPNGQKKINAFIVGGQADISPTAEMSWLFEGLSEAWNEEGCLLAAIPYKQGQLHGEALYYQTNGSLHQKVSYEEGLLHGIKQTYWDSGALLEISAYTQGEKHGLSQHFFPNQQESSREEFANGLLIQGAYFDPTGRLVSEIQEGSGLQTLFDQQSLKETREFLNGVPNGTVSIFNQNQQLLKTYQVHHQVKHGEEVVYFQNQKNQPKLSLHWYNGILQGKMTSWYENGNKESVRELSENKKQGLLTAWYENQSIMLIEDYDHDRLVKGDYYALNNSEPVSKIRDGTGVAWIFSSTGSLIKKIPYKDGQPSP